MVGRLAAVAFASSATLHLRMRRSFGIPSPVRNYFVRSRRGVASVAGEQNPGRAWSSAAREFVRSTKAGPCRRNRAQSREFKKQVLRFIRGELPSRQGRPPDPQIQAALEMLREGKTVRGVLCAQVRGSDGLDTYGRYLAEKALRPAIVRRRKDRARAASIPIDAGDYKEDRLSVT